MWIRKPRRRLPRLRRPLPWPSPALTRSASRVYAFVETGRRRSMDKSTNTSSSLSTPVETHFNYAFFSFDHLSHIDFFSFRFLPFPHGCLFPAFHRPMHRPAGAFICVCVFLRPNYFFPFYLSVYFALHTRGSQKVCQKVAFLHDTSQRFLICLSDHIHIFCPFPNNTHHLFSFRSSSSPQTLGAAAKPLPLRVLRVDAEVWLLVFCCIVFYFPLFLSQRASFICPILFYSFSSTAACEAVVW